MGDPIGQTSAAISLIDKIKSWIDKFGPTRLSIVGIDQEWISQQLIHHYRLRVTKPRYSKSASKSNILLNIPKNVRIAEFDLNLPGVQVKPLTKPISTLNVSSHELIGDCLEQLHDGQEISVSLRLHCPWEEVLEFDESRNGDRKTYRIKNPNNFPVKTCDIERQVLLTDQIREIEVIKQGAIVSQERLIKLSKTYFVDFEAGKIQTYFPDGISKSDDAWFKKIDRSESNCILRFTFDLDAHEEIEIRLYLS